MNEDPPADKAVPEGIREPALQGRILLLWSPIHPHPTPNPNSHPGPRKSQVLSTASCTPKTLHSSMTLYFACAVPVFSPFVVHFLPLFLPPICSSSSWGYFLNNLYLSGAMPNTLHHVKAFGFSTTSFFHILFSLWRWGVKAQRGSINCPHHPAPMSFFLWNLSRRTQAEMVAVCFVVS